MRERQNYVMVEWKKGCDRYGNNKSEREKVRGNNAR
jgi:hypothetical protein